jgi:rare lipoprotein A
MTRFPKLRLVLAVFAVVALAGCAGGKSPSSAPSSGYKVGKPYQIAGVWYYPHVDYEYDETGIASWYGPGFHGKKTASGETYDQNGLTAAHRTLPLPSLVRVTNLVNGRQITLRVNDRGPFAHGRILDVSKRGAQLLDFERTGTAKVRVEILAEESRQLAYQAGAYKVAPEISSGTGGSTASGKGSPQVAAAPVGDLAQEPLPPPPGGQAAAPKVNQPVTKPVQPATSIEDKVLAAAPAPDGKVSKVPVKAANMYVQAGAFTSQSNANRLASRLAKFGQARIVPVVVDRQKFYRVRVGPIASVADADRILDQVVGAGNPQAKIVVE